MNQETNECADALEVCCSRMHKDDPMPSHVIRSFVYDPESRKLEIRFQSGRRYMYLNVPNETFDSMKKAFSKGEFFNTHIRDHFEFVRVDKQ